MTDYTPVDALKHIWVSAFVAWAKSADMAIRAGGLSEDAIVLADLLHTVKEVVGEHIGELCKDDPDVYSDGRKAHSTVDLSAIDEYWWVWHPDPEHPTNQPAVVVEDYPGADGKRWRILIAESQLHAEPAEGNPQ